MSFPKQITSSKRPLPSLPTIPTQIPIISPLVAKYFPNARFERTFPFNLWYYTRGLVEFVMKKNRMFGITAIGAFAIFEISTYTLARLNRTGDNGRYERVFYAAEKKSKAQIMQLYREVGLDTEQEML